MSYYGTTPNEDIDLYQKRPVSSSTVTVADPGGGGGATGAPQKKKLDGLCFIRSKFFIRMLKGEVRS